MSLAEMLTNYQAETDPLIIHLIQVFQLSKLFEQALLVFLADANTRVRDSDQDAVFTLEVRRIDFHKPVLTCKFQCVLDQIY